MKRSFPLHPAPFHVKGRTALLRRLLTSWLARLLWAGLTLLTGLTRLLLAGLTRLAARLAGSRRGR